MIRLLASNAATLRREVIEKLLNPQKDVDTACGYPDTISISDYKTMYSRLGLAKRIVQLWPKECWQREPEVYETEEEKITEFEKQWDELKNKVALFSFLYRVDVLSGIGQYGILLLGLGDGEDLALPAQGINEKTGEKIGNVQNQLLYLRAYDQSVITIEKKETDIKSPRYGMPTMYKVKVQDYSEAGIMSQERRVHWTRIIHIADNRETSEVFGVPRMECVYNNLLDVKKVGGGSGEMFWKGGFPGYSFELTPEALKAGNIQVDTEAMKEQMLLWSSGLQRWLQLTGVTAKSLAPQVADPTGHVDMHVKLIAMSLGVPYRLLLGSEEAKLASTQDKRTWTERIAERQNNYLTPMLIRPFVDRLMVLGVLNDIEEYFVEWPDLNAPGNEEIADIALKRTDAFAKYVAGGCEQLILPRQYLTLIHKLSDEEVDAIENAMEEYQAELEAEIPEEQPIEAPEEVVIE